MKISAPKILIISIGKKLGDNILDTFLVHYLKRLYPKAEITILMHQGYKGVFGNNPDVSRIITVPNKRYFGHLLKVLVTLRREHFDFVIDVFFPLTYKKAFFDYMLHPQRLFAADSPQFKWVTHSIPTHPDEHLLVRAQAVLRLLVPQNPAISFQYFLYPREEICQRAARQYRKPGKKLLFFNPVASNNERSLSVLHIRKLLQLLAEKFPQVQVLLSYPVMLANLPSNTTLLPHGNLEELFAAVKCADAVLTVDTGVVHVASAFDKPLVALYPKATYRPAEKVFAPISSQQILLRSPATVGDIADEQILHAVQELVCL